MRMLHQISGNTTRYDKETIHFMHNRSGTRRDKDHKCNSIEEQHTASRSKK